MIDMPVVRSELNSQGWSRQLGTLEALRLAVSFDGVFRSLSERSREKTLVPYETGKAPLRSLSAVYGLDKQPLHTDGAHLPLPPDVIVLHSALPTLTSTVIWSPLTPGREALPSAARNGIFTVRGNGESFLAAVSDHRGLRFDPVVMSPADAFARETVLFLEAERPRALVHSWDATDLLLFINNRRALHARDEVRDAETRSITRTSYQWSGSL